MAEQQAAGVTVLPADGQALLAPVTEVVESVMDVAELDYPSVVDEPVAGLDVLGQDVLSADRGAGNPSALVLADDLAAHRSSPSGASDTVSSRYSASSAALPAFRTFL